jgi:hypothetical protein
MDFNNTRLPVTEGLYKAFCVWRTNARAYAQKYGAPEEMPLRMAKTIAGTTEAGTDLKATEIPAMLALLVAAPPETERIMRTRFGDAALDLLQEYEQHRRLGFNYIGRASEPVRAVALAAAVETFRDFTAAVDAVAQSAPASPTGAARSKLIEQLSLPGADIFERMMEKISLPSHPALEQLYVETREDYCEAAHLRAQMLAGLRTPASENAAADAGAAPFESQRLLDAPAVREAYALLLNDTRLQPANLAAALSAARLLSEHEDAKYPQAVAACLLRTGLPGFSRADIGFLTGTCDPATLGLLRGCDTFGAAGENSSRLREAPEAIRQIAFAQGIVVLNRTWLDSQDFVDQLELGPATLTAQQKSALKDMRLEPGVARAEKICETLKPLFGTTGAPQIEQIFAAEMDRFTRFLRDNLAPRLIPVSRRLPAPKPSDLAPTGPGS